MKPEEWFAQLEAQNPDLVDAFKALDDNDEEAFIIVHRAEGDRPIFKVEFTCDTAGDFLEIADRWEDHQCSDALEYIMGFVGAVSEAIVDFASIDEDDEDE